MCAKKFEKKNVITEITQTVYNADGSIYEQKKREVPEGYEVSQHPHKPKLGWTNEWIAMSQRAMMAIVKMGELSKNEYRLLIYLMASAGYHNTIITDLSVIAEDLSIAKPNASTALRGLVKRNIVVIRGKRRNYKQPSDLDIEINMDILNYHLGWKGNGDDGRRRRNECPPLLCSDGRTPLLGKKTKQILDEKCAPQQLTIDWGDRGEAVDIETGEIIEVD